MDFSGVCKLNWEYKNIFYPLKKEGLLGEQILDEVELEQAFNEYGIQGWELISLLNMRNGFVAIFKRPLTHSNDHFPIKEEQSQADVQDSADQTYGDEQIVEEQEQGFVGKYQQDRLVLENEEELYFDEDDDPSEDTPSDQDAGSIRIE